MPGSRLAPLAVCFRVYCKFVCRTLWLGELRLAIVVLDAAVVQAGLIIHIAVDSGSGEVCSFFIFL